MLSIMTELHDTNAIKAYKFFAVSTFEKLSKKTSYSIDTINYFNKKYETSSLRLIIGEDNFHNFTSWYKYLDILSLQYYCSM